MTTRSLAFTALVVAALLIGGCVVASWLDVTVRQEVDAARPRELLESDRYEGPAPFDPLLIDRRVLEEEQDGEVVRFEVNASAAVLGLDVPHTRSDAHPALLRDYSNYAEAALALEDAGLLLLPSVNLVGAKAKQFDDGLVSAIDLFLARPDDAVVGPAIALVRDLHRAAADDPDASAWLAAALVVGGASDVASAEVQGLARAFLADANTSTPHGFYTWSEDLAAAFRFLRYLSQPLAPDGAVARGLADALASDGGLQQRYEALLHLQRRVSNRFELEPLTALGTASGPSTDEVALLPRSASREAELFLRLYPRGVPQGALPMLDLIAALRDGTLDLAPNDESGWYELQMYALEVLVLPERAAEHAKLVLSRKYKQRLVEAYSARVTTIRETHLRSMGMLAASAAPAFGGSYEPRLRVEPNPTYYLRVARSYAFLAEVLGAALPEFADLHGLSENGPRRSALGEELEHLHRLFVGLHLVACEDLGLESALQPADIAVAEREGAYLHAVAWLENWRTDPDLAVDTRVAIPLEPIQAGRARYWCTTGIRPILLDVHWYHGPSVRPVPEPGAPIAAWTEIERGQLAPKSFVLLAEQFEQLEFRSHTPLTREAYRALLETQR